MPFGSTVDDSGLKIGVSKVLAVLFIDSYSPRGTAEKLGSYKTPPDGPSGGPANIAARTETRRRTVAFLTPYLFP